MSNIITKKEELTGRLKKFLSCTLCKPNRGENTKKGCKHFQKSWKAKGKSKKQFIK